MQLKKLPYNFTICKLSDISAVDFTDDFCFFAKTDEELSLVCRTEKVPPNATYRDDGWKAFRIQGELDFALVGILSEIAVLLAANKISIFAVSTYNTDYVLTKAADFETALNVLKDAGYEVV
jgi:hypothetical protein